MDKSLEKAVGEGVEQSGGTQTPGEASGAAAPAIPPPPPSSKNYHTPLAGGGSWTTFLRETIHIPTYDRADLTSITLGGSVLFPHQGKTGGLPVGALYIRRYWEDSRTRDIISIAVDELEYAKTVTGPLEFVGHFENYTLPDSFKEIVDNKKFQSTAVTWGDLLASVGPGLRWVVSPNEIDNDLRLQLLGRVGYFYAEKGHNMGPDVVVPPDTLLYGARLRGHYDGLLRNLLELPHRGNAAGFDLDYIRREKWANVNPGSDSVHHDYLQVKGYFLGTYGIPGLNERNRVLLYANAGTTNNAGADRYNAFTINGGPFPSEADDLNRIHYTGLLHDDVRATSYATGSLEYRRELTFFLYMSLVGSYIWGDRATVVGGDQVVFRDKTGAACTVSFDSALFWNSQIYIGYTWESGFIRNGRSGSGVTVFWNKMF